MKTMPRFLLTTALAFAFAIALASCGSSKDPTEPIDPGPTDPWDGPWGIISVDNVRPSSVNATWFVDDNDAGRFTNSVAFYAKSQRYVIRLTWTYTSVDGFQMPTGSTVVYTQEGTYTRGDQNYTLTANNEGSVNVASAIEVLDDFVVGVSFFEAEGLKWAVQDSESGTWARDGSILTLTSEDGLIREYKSRR